VLDKRKKGEYAHSPNLFLSKLVQRDEIYDDKQADSLLNEVSKSGLSFIKLFSLSNESTFYNLMASAKKYGVTVCGHYPAALDMYKVLSLQFKSIEHLGGYLNQPAERIDELIQLTKSNDIYNCPTLDWDIIAYNLLYPEAYKNRITYTLLPNRIIAKWEAEYKNVIDEAGGNERILERRDKYKEMFKKKTDLLLKLYKNDCLLILGSDAGNPLQADGFNVYEEMVNWSNIGIDNYTILKATTYNAAKFFNQENIWGSIREGNSADMIILDKNPLEDIKNITTVRYTILNGKAVLLNKDLFDRIN
jgi:imidazolonepropionase-like amidohydrolase